MSSPRRALRASVTREAYARAALVALGSRRSTLIAATIASGVTSLPTTALAVALPTLHSELHANVSELQWTLTAYSLAYAALLITGGRLGDMLGHRLLLISGAVLFGLASISAALAATPVWLIGSLAAVGVGGAMVVPASLAVVTTAFVGHARETGIGLWGAASGLISGLGPPIGGLLTDYISWRAIFAVQALAAVAIIVVGRWMAESRDDADNRVDVLGFVSLAGGICLLALPLIEASEWGWTAIPVVMAFAASGLLIATFVVVERRANNPIFELGLFRQRNFAAGAMLKFSMNFVLTALFFLLAIYTQEVLHYSPTDSGLVLLPVSLTFLLGLPLGERLLDRMGPRTPMLMGLGLMTLGVYFLSDLETTRDLSLWAPLLVLGFGLGIILTPVNAAALNAVPTAKHGEAAGILSTMIAIGSVFGVAVSGAFFKELEDSKLEGVLGGAGFPVHVDQGKLRDLLARTSAAEHYLHHFRPDVQDRLSAAVNQSFRYGIENAVRLSAGLLVLTLILTAVLVRGAPERVPEATASVPG
jgi:EmrB/QacA subfamily drug resistance transporter